MIRAAERVVGTFCFLILVLAAPGALAASSDRYASIVVDVDSGRVMHARDADELRYPASLTKMMTLYLLFDALEAGEIGLEDKMPVSSVAASQEPSKIYVKAGSTLKVEDAILALTTKSANDAAVVIGERLGGSVDGFARMMTQKARDLGMTRTRFRNPNGLPDEAQVTTARDLAILAEALFRDHRDYYSYFSATEFRYGNVTYRNHNRLLANMDGVTGVDGVKTGYTRASGYNLATSAERNGHRIVAVVLGGSTSRVRDAHMTDLVEQAFVALESPEADTMLVASLDENGQPLSYLKTPATETQARSDAREEEQAIALASLELRSPAEQGDSGDRGVRIVFSDDAGAPAPEEAPDEASATIQPVVVRMPPEPAPAPIAPEDQPALRTALREDENQDDWQIQVGAYRDQMTAMDRIAQISALSLNVLSTADSHVENATVNEAKWFRARFAGLSETSAREACAALTALGDGCFAVSPR